MKKITVTGLVQGVGFRPFVQREALKNSLTGTVKNTGGIVEISAQGNEKALERFIQCLTLNAPKESIIENITVESVPDECDFTSFTIVEGEGRFEYLPVIPADIATCDTCLEEMLNAGNRRYMHPFISCAVCGPRYSIIKKLPYDRCNTHMDKFSMCDSCKEEYDNTSDRRCYAQTVACNRCGPALEYKSRSQSEESPIDRAIADIRKGCVIAVKDIGGYHFVCSAHSESAANKLRLLKNRDKKPFAVMFETAENVKEYARVSEKEEIELISPARPIVLLSKTKDFPYSVCGVSDSIGAFLPCNPVQHILVRECGPLIMTSGNISDRPIITENNEIFDIYNTRKELDGILYHDRDIATPLDDSIVQVVSGRNRMIRRARGYTPLPLEFDCLRKNIFASGGELKSSFCIASGKNAYMSQHMGDLDEEANSDVYLYNTERLQTLTNITPDIYVTDSHPLYNSRKITEKLAQSAKKPTVYIQHHIAHAASVIAEHRISGDVLCFSFDGTGYGDDGTVWGAEVFEFRNKKFIRREHLTPVEMTGGDNISKNAQTVADCYLIDAGFAPRSRDGSIIKAAIDAKINTIKNSSMGRLFDGVSSLLGICNYNDYEGLCASMLESKARGADKAYPLSLPIENDEFKTRELIRQICTATEEKADTASIALGFHLAIINAVVECALQHGIKSIALSGGVFMNCILTEGCIDKLTEQGFDVYINQSVPTNDGGIALGQAYAALL